MSELPQELIDKIIDTLAVISVNEGLPRGAYLIPCSLVSHAFRPRCLRHILSTVIILDGPHETRKTRLIGLSNIIERNPEIARYIDGLVIQFGLMKSTFFILPDPTFLHLMAKISPIRQLTIASKGIINLRNPLLFMDNVIPFFASSITSLTIQCLTHVPVELISSCVNLSSLAVSFTSLTGQSTIQSPGTSTPSKALHHVQLADFSYQNSRIALEVLLRPSSHVDLSKLQTLTVYADKSSYNTIKDLLIVCSNALEEFSLLSVGDSACESVLTIIFHFVHDDLGVQGNWEVLNLDGLSCLRTFRFHPPFSDGPAHVVTRNLSSDKPWGLVADYIPRP